MGSEMCIRDSVDRDSLIDGEDVRSREIVRAYCDGSKSKGATGCGTVLYLDDLTPPH